MNGVGGVGGQKSHNLKLSQLFCLELISLDVWLLPQTLFNYQVRQLQSVSPQRRSHMQPAGPNKTAPIHYI